MLVEEGIRWDIAADVVIIGYGGAGAVAGITAREAGAEVVILEKQSPQTHHTNTSMAGGAILCPSDAKAGTEYLEALCQAGPGTCWTDKDTIRAWAEYAADNKSWIEARGGSFLETALAAEYPGLPGYQAMARHRFRGAGFGLARFLSGQVKSRNIAVMYDTPATRLLTNFKGQVVGVEAENREEGKARQIRVRASRGIVMTCGGFEFNEQMKLNYLKVYPTYFTGSEANTGDGVRMTLGVGADLWHMNCVSAWLVMKFPDFPIAMYPGFAPGAEPPPYGRTTTVKAGSGSGYIVVDRYGRRFLNETNLKTPSHAYYYELAVFDAQRLVYPRVPCYWVFDRKRMELGPLQRHRGVPVYDWSRDNSDETVKGWILTAGTVRDLARILEMSPDVLENTITQYNNYCERGSDADFGRNPLDLVPIEHPPYYAVKLWPGGANTQGGPRRNARAEVLNSDGELIPGLYSAGELGSVYGMLYPGAGNLAECVAFGRIAGENASRRKSERS